MTPCTLQAHEARKRRASERPRVRCNRELSRVALLPDGHRNGWCARGPWQFSSFPLDISGFPDLRAALADASGLRLSDLEMCDHAVVTPHKKVQTGTDSPDRFDLTFFGVTRQWFTPDANFDGSVAKRTECLRETSGMTQ